MLVDFQIFLDVMGLVQGLILGISLMVLSKNKNRSSFFLGLFVLFFSLELIHYIARSLFITGDYPDLLLLPFNFSWLLFSTLFDIYLSGLRFFKSQTPLLDPSSRHCLFTRSSVYLFSTIRPEGVDQWASVT